MAHVFISYDHDDGFFVDRLMDYLDHWKYACWVDFECIKAGENWRDAIEMGIRGAFAVIVVVSEESRNSEYVTYEWAYALSQRVRVIPLILKGQKEDLKFHERLGILHYFDFSNHNRKKLPWDDLHNQLEEAKQGHNFKSQVQFTPNFVHFAIHSLQNPDENERLSAAFILGRSNDPYAKPYLLQLMNDTSPRVRLETASILARLRDEDFLPYVLRLLYDEEHELRSESRRLVASWRDNAIPYIKELLNTDKPEIYQNNVPVGWINAVQTLSLIPSEQSTESLIELLSHPNPDVVGMAIYYLGNHIAPEAIEPLTALSKDERICWWWDDQRRTIGRLARHAIQEINSNQQLLNLKEDSDYPTVEG